MTSSVVDDDAFFREIEDILHDNTLQAKSRIGRYKRDFYTQTDDTELLPLRKLRTQTASLRVDMEVLKKEVAVKMKCLEAQYETVIHREANDLYTLIQRKARYLEEIHKEKVAVLHTSYRNQLADAISMIKGSFMKYHQRKSISFTEIDTGGMDELMTQLEEKSLEIITLTEQVKQYEEKIAIMTNAEVAEDLEKELLTDENARLKDENEKLKDDIDGLYINLEELRDVIHGKEFTIEHLEKDLKKLTIKAEEEKKTLEKVTLENNQLKVQLAQEREASKKKLNQLKKEMEKEITNIAAERKKESLAAEERMKQQKKDMEKAQRAHAAAAAAAAAAHSSVEDKKDMQKLKHILEEQKAEIQRLKKDRSSSLAWEKKFEILKKSFHAIKDEMFLRNNLQRQAAALHYASVSYTVC